MSPTSLLLFLCVSFYGTAAIAPGVQAEEGCTTQRCGNLTVSAPLGLIVEGSEENKCGLQMGFQVRCTDDVPYLGYYEREYRLRILGIFYGNFSLLVSDPINTASKLGQPFSIISPLNQNLIFYNCTKAPPPEEDRAGLVDTVCRNNTFVRAGERYYNDGVGGYELEGCNSTAVPVLGKSGRVNASDYLELIRNGFLLTWQPPPQQQQPGPQPTD
ncbi:hypothetical protein BRADI_2g02500v3 [Brachypodium distachyon]|uniref:Wall-associated receptor kinase galacturonan-binding domain-containing protein n=1 Tax=Brachypodium distachyon TaxID=15368 RepID=A0A0Q3FT47_BRADI|nr:hypothetical protein BRADI_2g02500v3 [Brachypodium distachyon]